MNRIYGYARCSTGHQQVDSQIQQLEDAGCTKVFSEKVSSRTPAEQRPQLQAVLTVLEESDTLCLTRLDRAGRTQNEVVNILHDLHTRGIFVKTLDGLIDTKSLGKMAPLVVGLLTGLAEVERNLILERSRESVEYRRRTNGNLGGRPKTSDKKERLVVRLRKEGESYRSIRDQTGISLPTIQRIVKEHTSIAA